MENTPLSAQPQQEESAWFSVGGDLDDFIFFEQQEEASYSLR